MRILQLHVDWIEWVPVSKEIELAEPVKKKPQRVEDALVLLTAVESFDSKATGKKAVKEALETAKKLKIDKLVIYPYAHLSSDLAEPSLALEVIKSMVAEAKKSGLKVYQAPFGWNKKPSLAIKGHPLAESGKSIYAEAEEEQEEEEGEMEELFVILPDGSVKKREEIKDEGIEKAIKSELKEISETSFGKPPHVELMRRLEIADHEKISDAGNLRYYPKGTLIVELLRDLGAKMAKELGALTVRTPSLINPNHPSVRIMMSKFPERLYRVLPGKRGKRQEFRLRPACDYGVWSMWKDAMISYKNLPLGLYEFDIIWRYEQRGELLGMYRVRNAMMPDLHELNANLEEAFERFEKHIENFALAVYKHIGIEPSVIVLNCKRDMYKKHEAIFKKWAKDLNLPIRVKIFRRMKTYKAAWIDVLAFDSLGRPMEISTVQLDTESAKWWEIKYTDKDGKERYPIILHTGFGIERTIAALLEDASGKKHPTLPLWLSPIQIRLIPVSDKYLEKAIEIGKKIESFGIRVDVDDRLGTMQSKIRYAELEWIPITVVIGEKEVSSGKLSVRFRATGEVKEMLLEDLVAYIKEQTKDMPFEPSNLPLLLTKRPKFVGAI